MVKKALCVIVLVLALVCVLTACDSEKTAHTHAFGEWETTKAATCNEDGSKERHCTTCDEREISSIKATGQHSWAIGFCTDCSLNCIEEIGKIIMNDPDKKTNGSYIKSFLGLDLCPDAKEGTIIRKASLGLAYDPDNKNLIVQMYYSNGGNITQSIVINGVTKFYDYIFEYDNRYYGGACDRIYGTFNAQTLKQISKFTYESAESTVLAALPYYIDSHLEYACEFAQDTVVLLNKFCSKYDLPFSAADLGFTGYA